MYHRRGPQPKRGSGSSSRTGSQATSPQAPEAAKKPHLWGHASRKVKNLQKPIKSTVSCIKKREVKTTGMLWRAQRMPLEAEAALQQERAPEGPGSPRQQPLTLQIPGGGDVLCGYLHYMD